MKPKPDQEEPILLYETVDGLYEQEEQLDDPIEIDEVNPKS